MSIAHVATVMSSANTRRSRRNREAVTFNERSPKSRAKMTAQKAFKLQFGASIPQLEVRTTRVPHFHFDTVVGRYVVLCFFGSADDPEARRLFEQVAKRQSVFDGRNVAFFGVSIDPEDERSGRVREVQPGIHVIWDFDCRVSRLFGAALAVEGTPSTQPYKRFSVLLDERARVVAVLPLGEPERHLDQLMEALEALPPLDGVSVASSAPILTVPRLFEPELCRALIRYYEELGGGESGFMQDIDGKTVGVFDYTHKRRRDQEILDETLRKACMVRIADRLVPEIQKAYQFSATRIERYIVACYEAETGGHFRAHRDNTTRGTAHRKFAVSLVLNTGEFEGGGISFPEFGRRAYYPPAGGAVVFSCSLMHEVSPVTRGKRYAFLPFLYDDAAARIRQENLQFVQAHPPRR
jgi:peroxiredoxin/predicted 2-oxoglutarate/Fe(II)-dependent dioxygenase YbiX